MVGYPLVLRRRTLAQAAPSVIVTVHDMNGRAIGGAEVEVFSGGRSVGRIATDSEGDARFVLQGAPARIEVRHAGRTLVREITAADARGTVFIQIPICHPGPSITTAELIGLVGGGIITAAGFLWKQEALKLGGEILIGSAAFTLIYRYSCP